jgi:hypothetical protein
VTLALPPFCGTHVGGAVSLPSAVEPLVAVTVMTLSASWQTPVASLPAPVAVEVTWHLSCTIARAWAEVPLEVALAEPPPVIVTWATELLPDAAEVIAFPPPSDGICDTALEPPLAVQSAMPPADPEISQTAELFVPVAFAVARPASSISTTAAAMSPDEVALPVPATTSETASESLLAVAVDLALSSAEA